MTHPLDHHVLVSVTPEQARLLVRHIRWDDIETAIRAHHPGRGQAGSRIKGLRALRQRLTRAGASDGGVFVL